MNRTLFTQLFIKIVSSGNAFHKLNNFRTTSTFLHLAEKDGCLSSPTSNGNDDQVFKEAEKIIENTDTQFNIQNLLKDDLSLIAQILQQLNNVDKPNKHASRLYQSFSSSEHPVRGLVVLLLAKAAQKGFPQNKDIAHSQLLLGKIVEMIHLATVSHKEILEIDSKKATDEQHLSSKTSILFGDFFWAKAWKDLGDLNNMNIINTMTAVTVNIAQGQFKSEIELQDIHDKLNLEYWVDKNYLLNACLPALGCKSALLFAGASEPTLQNAFYFGQNFGFCMKAKEEVAWFQRPEPTSTRLFDLCSLPLIMHYTETKSFPEEIIQRQNDNKIDYSLLHSIIRNGPGIDKSREVLQTFKENSLKNLTSFEDGKAKQCLVKIIDSIKV